MLLLSQQFYRNKSHVLRISNIKHSSLLPWVVYLIIAAVGITALYSVAGSRWHPWAFKQLIHFCIGMAIMITIASMQVYTVFLSSFAIYCLSIILLIVVNIAGHRALGATRWINFGFISIQPSEISKIATVMLLACHFNRVQYSSLRSIKGLMIPLLIVLIPFTLIYTQPDLATSLILLNIFIGIMFVVGVNIWHFVAAGLAVLISIPIIWHNLLPYQKLRIVNFFNPDHDPLGSGYNIIQSKIAIGSGGVFGKGIGQGAQSQLNFLPESQTDFAFTTIAEECGFIGCTLVIGCYIALIIYGWRTARRSKNYFCKVLTCGANLFFFVHVFSNIGMVTGILPVMGIPMPMISYGGTAVVVTSIFLGFIIFSEIHKDVDIS
jgi:rod shape determining protein RodA